MYTNKSKEGPSSRRDYRSTQKLKSKKDQKLLKLMQPNSDSEDESEHELSYYINDRVKLMKEVLKIIKPRKIKTMAPECMKKMDIQEINSILLEELLGISNKRLRYIFEAKVLEEESSTDEDQPVDVISLDSISDDDFVVISDDEGGKPRNKHKRKKIKEEPRSKSKKVKREKPDKDNESIKEKDKKRRKEIDQVREKLKNKDDRMDKEKETMGEENLMSVLELLELQARARAIRSQLELECKRKKEEQKRLEEDKRRQESQNGRVDEEDEIIIEVMQDVEIVITSSDSENESKEKKVKPKKKPLSPQKTKSPEKNSTSHNQQAISKTSSTIELNEDSSQDSHEIDLITQKLNEPGVSLIHTSDKEDGEVSDEEPKKGDKLDNNIIVKKIKEDVENKDTVVKSEEEDSDSSNDNLLLVKKREERKRVEQQYSEKTDEPQSSETTIENTNMTKKPEENTSSDTNENNPEPNETKKPEEKISSDTNENNPKPDESEPTNILDKVVEEFVKSQPPPPDNSEEVRRLEEEKKQFAEKNEEDKKKRLKNLKNKLESFKQDVAVESTSANVTVLENIVIKPKEVDVNRKSLEHSDDLVINLDQDDYDCITLD